MNGEGHKIIYILYIMSSTRIRNDIERIHKEMEIFTNSGRYAIDTPKWNNQQEYMEDPHIRIQNWDGNKYKNRIDIENEMLGYTHPLSRDYVNKDEYLKFTSINKPTYENNSKMTTDESRSVLPAFIFRDLEINRFEELFINPQNNIEREFAWNIDTRLIEKDLLYDKPFVPNEMNGSCWLPITNRSY